MGPLVALIADFLLSVMLKQFQYLAMTWTKVRRLIVTHVAAVDDDVLHTTQVLLIQG